MSNFKQKLMWTYGIHECLVTCVVTYVTHALQVAFVASASNVVVQEVVDWEGYEQSTTWKIQAELRRFERRDVGSMGRENYYSFYTSEYKSDHVTENKPIRWI
jgi:hypothetical protein